MEKKDYFSISEIASICSTSRSTILRMENDGILTPAFIDEENGYRYYNSDNVLRVIRNLSLKDLGITHKELNSYYSGDNNYSELLSKLQNKMNLFENYLSSLKLQLGIIPHLQISDYYFPETVCYYEKLPNVLDTSIVFPHVWSTFDSAAKKGYKISKDMHPFVTVNASNFLSGDFTNYGYDYTICIPIYSDTINKYNDSELITFPATNTFSVLLHGGAMDITSAFTTLSEHMPKCKCCCQEEARIIAVVSSYPGEVIPKENWIYRVCIPSSK